LDLGLTGLEFAAGIPGTIGGGMVMNAGAYGSELSCVTEAVELMDEQGNCLKRSNEQMAFGYRTSAIKGGTYIVTEAVLALEPGNPEEIRRTMDELAVKRREKQPLEYPSAGSTFKRPEGYFAGELIMKAGLAGFCIGGAEVSKKHCGFVINTGGATASDVRQVICEVQRQVKHRFGVELEPEVIFLGEF
ncbi:MAG: UDP-N-acetylmuramate dehydrogenase, partial [Acetatifactor sp.]|nr:UDP-N-acetylmuramate dehydrogenase [Acetatifactor sp.]